MVKYFERAKRTALKEAFSESLLRPQDYKDRCGLLSPEDLSDRVLYCRFFELKLQAAAKLFKDWGPNDTVNYLGLPDSLVSLPEDSKVRSWIVERLKADPNFFMPHLCWVKLGFPGEVESCEEIEATPPSMDALLCYPSFEEKIVRLTEILEAAIAKQERNELFGKLKPEERFKEGREWSEVQEAYDTLHERILNFDLDPEFYECWRVVKEYVKSNIYRGVICDVYQIFDSAYEKYILNERKPAVDLAKLFADLAHSRCDHSGVIERIQKSYYEIEPGKKERYDPLYTER